MHRLIGRLTTFVRGNTRHLLILLGMLVALVAYVLGVKLALGVLLVVLGTLYLPAPKLFSSWVSRIVLSLIASIVLLQLAAVLQFLLWPESNFSMVATLYTLLFGLVLFSAHPTTVQAPSSFISRHDLLAVISMLIFIAPLASLISGNPVQDITMIGGLQSPDAEHHYEFINRTTDQQHLDASGYPQSFHLAIGFLDQSLGLTQSSLSWTGNAMLFFGQHLAFGLLLIYILFYLCATWIQSIAGRIMHDSWLIGLGVAVSLGVVLSVLVVWPFLLEGFLNYYFVATCLALSAMYFFDYRVSSLGSLTDKKLLAGELLLFSVSATWPLLLPVVLLYLATIIWPKGYSFWVVVRAMLAPQSAIFLVVVVLMIVPLIIQVYFPGSTEINALGALRTPHLIMLIGGMGLLAFVFVGKIGKVFAGSVFSLFAPLVIFTAALTLMQFFIVGEVRYFSIKVSRLLEAFIVVLGVALITKACKDIKLDAWRQALIIATVPLLLVVLLVSPAPDPIKDVRDLFRDYSGQGKPAFYNQDSVIYAQLGSEDKIDNFNSTVLHYYSDSGKFMGHTLLAQWVQTIKHDRDVGTLDAWRCHRSIYNSLTNGVGGQDQLVATVKECALITKISGRKYYIITDSASVPYLKQTFGEDIEYVSP